MVRMSKEHKKAKASNGQSWNDLNNKLNKVVK